MLENITDIITGMLIYGGVENADVMFNFCNDYIESTSQLRFLFPIPLISPFWKNLKNISSFFLEANGVSSSYLFPDPGVSVGQGIIVEDVVLLVYGGLNLYSTALMSSAWIRSLWPQANAIWMKFDANNPIPSFSFSSVAVFKNISLIFGGQYLSFTNYSRLWKFDMSLNTFTEIPSNHKGSAPTSRWGSAVAAIQRATNSKMLVFGGSYLSYNPQGALTNDTWLLDVSSLHRAMPMANWTKLNISIAPVARCLAAAVYQSSENGKGNSSVVYLHGGCNSSKVARTNVCDARHILNDMWMFNLSSETWEEISTNNSPHLYAHSVAFAVFNNSGALIFYGAAPSDTNSSVFVFYL